MATVKSSNVLLSELRAFLRAYNRNLDTGDNSLAKDLLLFPYSVAGRGLMEQVGLARDAHILSKLTGSELDNEASNYTLERSTGTYATVIMTLYCTTKPVVDITVSAGTQCQTTGTTFVSPVTFVTVSDTVFAASSMDAYYNYDRARYEFPVTAVASAVGEASNVGSNTINKLITPVAGIIGVTNLNAATGGSGLEDDDSLKERVRLHKLGRDLNVTNGLKSYAIDNGFTGAYPVRIEDVDSERADGVDLFVIDNTEESISETFTFQLGVTRYYFANCPVKSVTSVTGAISGVLSTSDYSVNIDNTSALRRSTDANDYIEIVNPTAMAAGETFVVVYTYNSSINRFQTLIETDANNVLTANTLVKRAFPVRFYMTATLSLKINSDGPTTRTKIRNALIQYFSDFGLGEPVQKSDLIVILQTGYGDFPVDSVDSVIISSYYLTDEFGTTTLPVDENLAVTQKQYIIYGSSTIL